MRAFVNILYFDRSTRILRNLTFQLAIQLLNVVFLVPTSKKKMLNFIYIVAPMKYREMSNQW